MLFSKKTYFVQHLILFSRCCKFYNQNLYLFNKQGNSAFFLRFQLKTNTAWLLILKKGHL